MDPPIHHFIAIKMDAAICKFYGSSFRSHPRPAIFSCKKQLFLLLDFENWCLILFLCIILIMNIWFLVQTVLQFTAFTNPVYCCYSPRCLPIVANEPEVSPLGLLPH